MTETTTWVPHRDGGVMVTVDYLHGDTTRGHVYEGSEGHLCPDYARAELWWLEWQRRSPQFAAVTVRFTAVAASPTAGGAR